MELERQAAIHAALGDPSRLAIVERLVTSDRAPSELIRTLGLSSNLLAHHLDVLSAAGVVERVRSSGDRRRRYVTLRPEIVPFLGRDRDTLEASRVVFVCTANSARSLLAEILWRTAAAVPATSGGTEPADAPHPGAVRVARAAGLDLAGAVPGPVPRLADDDLLVTVCDIAHESLGAPTEPLHWSIPDPALDGDFDAAFEELEARVHALAPMVHGI